MTAPRRFVRIYNIVVWAFAVGIVVNPILYFGFGVGLDFYSWTFIGILGVCAVANLVSLAVFWRCASCRKMLPLCDEGWARGISPKTKIAECPHCAAQV